MRPETKAKRKIEALERRRDTAQTREAQFRSTDVGRGGRIRRRSKQPSPTMT
jgi:hypothetical protein